MTKEVDFLSLSKVNSEKVNTNNVNNSAKKEGLSLFDSLLINNKTEDTNANLVKEGDSTKTSLSNQAKEENDVKSSTNTSSEIKTTEEKVDLTKIENKNDKTLNLNETEKNEVKSTQSSVLDKMIIESKKNIKVTEASDVIKNTNINNTLSKNQDINTETPKELKDDNNEDKLLKEKGIDKNIENSSLNKENKNENLNILNPNLKEDLNKVKTENIVTIAEETKELKNEDSPKISNLKVEIEKNDISINKIEDKTENNTVKEQIQTTLNFEETSVEEVKLDTKNVSKDEVNNIIKNLDNSKNILEKTTENIELKDISKVEIKSEIKLDENIEEKKTFESGKLNSDNIQKINNDVVSKEFSKLDSSTLNENEKKVNIDKNILLDNDGLESKNSKSLMDKLLDNATKTVNLTSNLTSTMNENNLDSQVQSMVSKTNEFVTNIFLGSQKNSIYNQMLTNSSEAVKIVKDGKSLEDIKKGAEILNLGLKDSSVETEVQKEVSKIDTNKSIDNKENILNRLAFNKNTNNENIENKLIDKIADKLEAKISNPSISSQAATTMNSSIASVIEEPITLAVNPTLVLSIQNKIIGAQQHMSSMMSDVARNMYENYKPPVTAFRLNLFPAQLGQIAILMKNDKENSISISLNMSNSNTMDAFVENQSVLRDALNRNFNNNQTIFNLDFNLDSEGSGNGSFNEQNQENNKNTETPSSSEIMETINETQNTGEDLNYL